jgi:hypothetical protein
MIDGILVGALIGGAVYLLCRSLWKKITMWAGAIPRAVPPSGCSLISLQENFSATHEGWLDMTDALRRKLLVNRREGFLFVLLALMLFSPIQDLSAKESAGMTCEAVAKSAADITGKPAMCEATGPGQGFEPCPPGEECPATFGPIITDGAAVMEKGKFSIQPTWEYSMVTDRFSPNWRRVSAGGNYSTFNQYVKLTYGLWDNLEVFAEMVTYAHNWARKVNEPGPEGETSADFGSIGETLLVLKYQFTQETDTIPIVTGYFGTVLPTGHYRHLNPGRLGIDQTGEGGYRFIVGLNLQKYLKPFILYGNLWYRVGTNYRADGADADGNTIQELIQPRNGMIVNFAAEYPITKKWVAQVEVLSNWDTGFQLSGNRSNQPMGSFLAVSPGIEYMATEKLSMALGLYVDVLGKNTDATITPIFSMVYAF